MTLKSFLKDKLLTIILIMLSIFSLEIFLNIYPYGSFLRIYAPCSVLGMYFIGLILEYISKRNFYNNIINTQKELDEKYLVTAIVKEPSFIEGRILKDVLEQSDKSMIENVNKYKYLTEDYKEYIELWIHEIKIPIACRKNAN